MSKITNTAELRSEILRIQKLLKEQEQQIRDDIKEIREELKPANLLMHFVSSVTGIKTDRESFFKDGILFGLSLIIQRFILKSERKFEKKIYDWIDNLFERIRHFINRFTDPSEKRKERKEKEQEQEDFIPGE